MNMLARQEVADQAVMPEVRNLPEILRLIGKCRGFALNLGMLAVLLSTKTEPGEREKLQAEFLTMRMNYLAAIEEKVRIGPFLGQIKKIAQPRTLVHAFHDTLLNLPDDRFEMTRDEAAALARRARHEVMPAIYEIMEFLGELETEEAEAHLARMAEKAALVEGMLTEMGRIGRMIGLVSINASVEAARAGGESGRSFQVIAEEVRSLARQSAEVLDRMKNRMSEKEAMKRMRLKRTFS